MIQAIYLERGVSEREDLEGDDDRDALAPIRTKGFESSNETSSRTLGEVEVDKGYKTVSSTAQQRFDPVRQVLGPHGIQPKLGIVPPRHSPPPLLMHS